MAIPRLLAGLLLVRLQAVASRRLLRLRGVATLRHLRLRLVAIHLRLRLVAIHLRLRLLEILPEILVLLRGREAIPVRATRRRLVLRLVVARHPANPAVLFRPAFRQVRASRHRLTASPSP